ncbi:hypothetical protein CLF_111659, partial [Clonorchis sinensis]
HTADGGKVHERCQRQLNGSWGTPELPWIRSSPAGSTKRDRINSFFLDTGSDTTLPTIDVAKQFGIGGEAECIGISSVNVPDIEDTMTVNFAIQYLLDGYVVDHARILENDVLIVIETNVPEAHGVIEQRLSSPKHPNETLTALGSAIFRPFPPAGTDVYYFKHASPVSLCGADYEAPPIHDNPIQRPVVLITVFNIAYLRYVS